MKLHWTQNRPSMVGPWVAWWRYTVPIWRPGDHISAALVQVMVWCHQATSHYLSQCWPRSVLPYGIIRPQWVNTLGPEQNGSYVATCNTWWHHQMETFSAILALCAGKSLVTGAGNSPVTNEFPLCQWRRALMFSLICAWINSWVNNREAQDDLRRHRAHYDVSVINFQMQFLGNFLVFWFQITVGKPFP